jgi:hypothetical protein
MDQVQRIGVKFRCVWLRRVETHPCLLVLLRPSTRSHTGPTIHDKVNRRRAKWRILENNASPCVWTTPIMLVSPTASRTALRPTD